MIVVGGCLGHQGAGVALLALNETQQSIANRWIITVNRISF
jgi:hypothetical protein